ncbi:hypothetical protein LXL04_023541 [Taraxacum kok-saghyz]
MQKETTLFYSRRKSNKKNTETGKDVPAKKRKSSSKTKDKKTQTSQSLLEQDDETIAAKKSTTQQKQSFHKMRTRSSPAALFSTIQELSKEQITYVRRMGFSEFIRIKITEVPGTIGYYMLQSFDTTTYKINLLCGSIDVTTDLVNQMMGFPVATMSFDDLPYPDTDDTSYSDWQSQFDKKNSIKINEIKTKILLSDQPDMNFKLNFLAIMINSLTESSSHGKANYAPLKSITKETNIRNINWCEFLIASLRRNKHTYNSSNTNSFFVGPSPFLVVRSLKSPSCYTICTILHIIAYDYLSQTQLENYPDAETSCVVKFVNHNLIR